jgi:hypothetical protein
VGKWAMGNEIMIIPEFEIKLLVRVGSREQGVGSSVYN